MINLPKYRLGRIADLEYTTEENQQSGKQYILFLSEGRKAILTKRLLKYLLKRHTQWDIPVNEFFIKHFKVDPNNQNEGNKTVEILKELELNHLIEWNMEPIIPWKKGQRFVLLSKHTINARITSKGSSYIKEQIKSKKQFWTGLLKGMICVLTGILLVCLIAKLIIS